MRSLYLVVLVLVLMTTQGCRSKQHPPYSPEFKFFSKEVDGLYNIRSSGFGTDSEATVSDAQKNVFYHIVFNGIPDTNSEFMLSFTLSSNMINVKSGLQVLADVKVKCNSLRKDLKQNQVIRKFGC